MRLFHIFREYDANQIRDELGWANGPDSEALTEAIMVLCDTVRRLEIRVRKLEQQRVCLPESIQEALNSGVGVYRP